MWWLVYIGICAFMALVINDRHARYCLAYCSAGLLAMQLPQVVPLDDWRWLFSGAVWSAVAVASWRHSVTFFALTLTSATCYTYGRIGGYDFAATSAPLFWADMAGLAALASLGGRYVARLIYDAHRNRSMGGGVYRSDFNRSLDAVEKKAGR